MSGIVNLALSALFIGDGLNLTQATLSIGVSSNSSLTTSGGALSLVNDSLNPGTNMSYSTNSSGTKGWYSTNAIQLANTYIPGVIAATGTITIQDSTGTTYKVLVST